MIIRLIKTTVGNFEYNPRWQFRFHLITTWTWLIGLLAMPIIVHPHDDAGWLQLLILEVSLYANFTSDFTGMSASLGATNVQPAPRPFQNPNYRPPKLDSLGQGWDDMDSAAYGALLDDMTTDEADF